MTVKQWHSIAYLTDYTRTSCSGPGLQRTVAISTVNSINKMGNGLQTLF